MDFVSILAGVLTLAALPAIALIADRVLRSGDPPRFPAIFERPWELGWPTGVQEEEPVRYRVELIGQGAFRPRAEPCTHTSMRRRIERPRERNAARDAAMGDLLT